MARSGTTTGHICRDSSQGFLLHMDCKVWNTNHNNNRSRYAIRSRTFQSTYAPAGMQMNQDITYHPQSNGMLERWHRTLKAALKCHLQGDSEWTTSLPTGLLGLRTSYKEDVKCSTAELVYDTTLRIPGKFFEDIEQHITPELFVEDLREQRDDTVRRPLQPPYLGPYETLARINERLYTILNQILSQKQERNQQLVTRHQKHQEGHNQSNT